MLHRKTLLACTLGIIGLTAMGCESQSNTGAAKSKTSDVKTVDTLPAGVKILPAAKPLTDGKTPMGYTIKGDEIHVNNRTCAQTGSPLAEDALDKFQSRVVYDGPVTAFKGKTFVFNQCCGMCIGSFPKKWAKERDAILVEHRILSLN